MKFDPFVWQEVKPNEKIPSGKGWLRVRCSVVAPLYIAAEGYEALAGRASDFEVEVSEDVIWHIAGPKDCRVFVRLPVATISAPDLEVYTNIDRMPEESGMVAEVTRARRLLEMERKSYLREIRAERDAAVAAAREARAVEVPQDDPAPVVESEAPE